VCGSTKAKQNEPVKTMTLKSDRLLVELGASQVRRRLKGHGFGVRKVETAGKNRAVIIYTATGEHLRQLESLFRDMIGSMTEEDDK
jgi:DNA transformation protein and related proteins